MNFRIIRVVAAVLCLSAGATHAQNGKGSAPGLEAGKAALRDGFYELADKQFRYHIATAPDPAGKVEGVLLLAQSLDAQQKYNDLEKLLKEYQALARDPGPGNAFVFWMAKAYYEQGKFQEALRAAEALSEDPPDDPYVARICRLQARCYLKDKQPDKALAVLKRLNPDVSAEVRDSDSLLDWAAVLVQMERREDARVLLEQLSRANKESDAVMRARYWLARIYLEEHTLDAAESLLREITQSPATAADTRSEAWISMAALQEARTNLTEAVTALAEAEKGINDTAVLNRIAIFRAKLALAGGDVDTGARDLRQLIAQLGDTPDAGEALLFLARVYFDKGRAAEADQAYQQYLEFFQDEQGRAQAALGKAWSLYELKRYAEAVSAFEKAYGLLGDPALKKEAFFKTADALFADSQFKAAREKYVNFTRTYPGDPLLPEALFQSALCLVKLQEYEQAEGKFKTLSTLYPASPYAERSFLQVALVQELNQEWEQAINSYEDYLKRYISGVYAHSAWLHKGLNEYRLARFKSALQSFDRIIQVFPDSASLEQASYMRGWALYLDGRELEALSTFKVFTEQFPVSQWTEHVLFWMARYFYNQGNYQEARQQFQDLTTRFSEGDLKELAYYWAGRAANEEKDYVQAIKFFSAVVEGFPDSERIPDALFWQGDALTALGEFSAAILIFNRIIREFPDSYRLCAAYGRRGDCHFTLGEKDPARYADAVEAYQAVLDSPDCGLEIKLQAECKIARTLQSMQDIDQSVNRYMSVVYKYLAHRDELGTNSISWFTRAALAAAKILESQEKWREAINVYKRVVDAGVPASEEARKRIQKIRVEQLIIF